MKNYYKTINRSVIITVICLIGLYVALVIGSFTWLYSYQGSNIELLFQTSIYGKMETLVNVLKGLMVGVFIVSTMLIFYSQIGDKRKYYIRNYGKADFFKSTFKLNLLLSTISSGLIVSSYFVTEVFIGLTDTEFASIISYFRSPSLVEYGFVFLTLISIQLICIYVMLGVKDRLFNNLNKYRSRSYRYLLTGGYLIRVITLSVLLLLLVNSDGFLAVDRSKNLVMFISSQFSFNKLLFELTMIGMAIASIIDYYDYYQMKVIG